MPSGRFRIFGGKRYERIMKGTHLKAKAKRRKEIAKGRGCKARMVQDTLGWWYVYARCRK